MRFSLSAGLAALGLTVLASAAFAQDKDKAASASEPFTKKIGEWTINCTTTPSPNPCQMIQGVALKSTGQQLLNISFVYVPSADQNGMIVVVPLGVSIPRGVILKSDAFTSSKLPYDHCDRNGCYSEVPIPKDTLQTLGKTANAQILIAGDDGKVVPLAISLDGFSEAHDAMVAVAKQKASAPPATGVINGAK